MNFLGRKAKATESTVRNEARSIVHREIEITIERTWTTGVSRVPAECEVEKVLEGQLLLPGLPDG